jgi:hypothetical protein
MRAIAAALAVGLLIAAPGAQAVQCGNAYTDMEQAGAGGTYGSGPGCADEVPSGADSDAGAVVNLGERELGDRGGLPQDAPPAFRGTATDEGEREQ